MDNLPVELTYNNHVGWASGLNLGRVGEMWRGQQVLPQPPCYWECDSGRNLEGRAFIPQHIDHRRASWLLWRIRERVGGKCFQSSCSCRLMVHVHPQSSQHVVSCIHICLYYTDSILCRHLGYWSALMRTSQPTIFLQHFIKSIGGFWYCWTYGALTGNLRIWRIAISNFVFSDQDSTSLWLSFMLDTSAICNSSPLFNFWLQWFPSSLSESGSAQTQFELTCWWLWVAVAYNFVVGISKKVVMKTEIDTHVI